MNKLAEKEFFDRLKYFNVSKSDFLKVLRINNSNPEERLKYGLSHCKSYGGVIDCTLTWLDTPQGYDFWKNICDNIDEIKISLKNQINKIKIK